MSTQVPALRAHKPSGQRESDRYARHDSSVANCDWNSRGFFGNVRRGTRLHYPLRGAETASISNKHLEQNRLKEGANLLRNP
jgi:hypothetical protein